MRVVIESLDQKMLLSGGDITTSLTLVLPNGSRVNAQVDPEAAQTIMSLHVEQGGIHKEPEDEAPYESNGLLSDPETDTDVFGASSASSASVEAFIVWSDLSDEHLSPKVKAILTSLGVPPSMPASKLVSLIDEITEKMLSDKLAQQPQVGRVQRPAPLQMTRARTVPKDEAGYPILPRQDDRDPGEMSQMGSDEDGVPQL